MNLASTAALLTGLAVISPAVYQLIPKNKKEMREVFYRAGTLRQRRDEIGQTASRLAQAGIKMRPEEFAGIRYVLVGAGILVLVPLLIMGMDCFWAVLIFPLLWVAPNLWLNQKIARRKAKIMSDLPDFEVILSTAVAAGADLRRALREASLRIGGPIAEEVEKALTEEGSGKPISEALMDMAERCDIDDFRSLAKQISQSFRYGSSLAESIKDHSEQIRLNRRYEIMEAANKLSIKLIFPVLIFILLPTMVVILYPVVVSLMQVLR